jgi:hypothetical protein
MNARIGAPSAMDAPILPTQLAEGLFEFQLNSASFRLTLKSSEFSAVV